MWIERKDALCFGKDSRIIARAKTTRHPAPVAAKLLGALILLSASACLTPGCETTRGGGTPDTNVVAKAPVAAIDTDKLVAASQRLRDREFDNVPAFEAVAALPPLASESSAPPDQALVARVFFGAPKWPAAEHPLESLARYDGKENKIRYTRISGGDAETERAIVFALGLAMDAQHREPDAQPTNWDEAFAASAGRFAGPAFLAAVFEAERAQPPINAATLAKRVDLVAAWPGFARYLGDARPDPTSDVSRLAARSRASSFREGLSLAAAMYRSAGWSGVETLWHERPARSADVVRPDRWMAGEGTGQWHWSTPPADGESFGTLGPALSAVWLSRRVDTRLSRSIYGSWQADAYRVVDDGKDWTLRWVSAWTTPHDAQQMTEAISAGFSKREGVHAQVVRDGVIVAALVSTQPVTTDAAVEAAKTRPQFVPAQGPPLSFVPSAADRLLRSLGEARFDGDHWSDPVLGFEIEGKELGDAWTLQKTDEAGLRWFAKHNDGSLIELTTELSDPAAPAFSTKDYGTRVVAGFRNSLKDPVGGEITRQQLNGAAVLVTTIEGKIGSVASKLRVWQTPLGEDFILTYSLQTAPDQFDTHIAAAQSVLSTLRLTNQPAEKEARPKGDGVIEFKVE